MYNNLKGEIVRAGLNKMEISKLIGISYNTFRDKIRDKKDWKINEMIKIQQILSDKTGEDKTIDYLFKK